MCPPVGKEPPVQFRRNHVVELCWHHSLEVTNRTERRRADRHHQQKARNHRRKIRRREFSPRSEPRGQCEQKAKDRADPPCSNDSPPDPKQRGRMSRENRWVEYGEVLKTYPRSYLIMHNAVQDCSENATGNNLKEFHDPVYLPAKSTSAQKRRPRCTRPVR